MDSDSPKRQTEIEIFGAALLLADPEERRAFLKRACKQDSALQKRVEELLALQSKADEFFSSAQSNLQSLLPELVKTKGNLGRA